MDDWSDLAEPVEAPVPGQPLRVDIAAPFADIAEEIEVTPPEQRQTSFGADALSALGRGGRDVMNAAGSAADLVTLPVSALMNLFGANIRPYREITDEAATSIGLPENQTAGQDFLSAINEGGMLGLATAGAGGAAGMLPGVTGAVGRTLAATPVADMAASAGGMAGQEIAEQSGGGPMAQLGAALVGGALGAGGVASAARAPSLLPRNRQLNELGQAAERIGVDLLPADAGGPTTRRLSSAAVQAPVSAAPLINSGRRLIEQAKTARDKVAAAFGEVMNPEAAGNKARDGALATINKTGKIGGRLYDRASELAGDTRVPLNNAKSVLDEQIARLEAVPGGGAGLADAKALRAQLDSPDGFSVQGVRDMRTELFVAPELRGGPVEARMKEIVNAASRDIEEGLRAQGKGDAADAFRAADDYWRERLDLIDNVLRPVIGKSGDKSGEAIFKGIESASKGDAERLHRFLRALPPEEQGIVRASIIGRLGRARNSAQDEAGEAFSLETFLTNWNDLSPRSKNILFDGDYRKDMDALAKVADSARQAGAYASKSNTPGGIWGNIGVYGGLSPLIGIQNALVGAGLQYGAGKLLASPRFARWLASAAKKPNEQAFQQQVGRLSAVAAAEPTIANEVRALQEQLMQSFTQTPYRAAASPDEAGAEKEVNQ